MQSRHGRSSTDDAERREGKVAYEAALRRFAEQEARISQQKTLIQQLGANGATTDAAERVLIVMENALAALRVSLGGYSGRAIGR